MATVIQKSAFKPGKYRGKLLTSDQLAQYAEGTNKALSLGVPVPGLKKHATLAADDTATEKASATDGAGWLQEVLVENDGAIGWRLDVPDEIASGIKDGTIKFTSPEFRPHYKAADGRYEGPIIRHVAFTPLPKSHDQGALAIAMSEEAFQFGEDDYEGPDDAKKGADEPETPPAEEPKNPDSPPKATDQTKVAALRECFSALGAELTSDWTPDKDGAIDELLAALKTLAKAKSEAESKDNEPEEPDVKESQAMPFSEDEMSALPAPMQAKARKANEQAMQFSEERASTKKQKAIADLNALNLPPAMKKAFVEPLETLQFSEADEANAVALCGLATKIAGALPPNMQFAEEHVTDSKNRPAGDEVTDSEAEEIVNRMFGRQPAANANAA